MLLLTGNPGACTEHSRFSCTDPRSFGLQTGGIRRAWHRAPHRSSTGRSSAHHTGGQQSSTNSQPWRKTYLRRSVARTSASSLERISLLIQITESEIHNLQRFVIVYQKVFRLQVTVADAELVNVLDARDELLKVLAGHLLLEALVLHNEVEQLASADVLHDQVQVLFCFDDLVNLNHIRVVQLLQNLNFSADALHILAVFDPRFFENFDGHLQKFELLFAFLGHYKWSLMASAPSL